MVLAYEEEDYGVMTEAEARKRDHRRTFQVCLLTEYSAIYLHNDKKQCKTICFYKFHGVPQGRILGPLLFFIHNFRRISLEKA